MLVLVTFRLVTTARKMAFRDAKTGGTGENSKNGKNKDKSENLGTNFI